MSEKSDEDIIEILDALYYIDVTSRILTELVNMVESEKPDLIISETMAVHVKYLVTYLMNKHKTDRSNMIPPPVICFSTTFPIVPNIFPNQIETALTVRPSFQLKRFLKTSYYVTLAYIEQFFFCRNYGFRYISPFGIMYELEADLNIVCVLPELQARFHLIDSKTVKFVGSTISENLRNSTQAIENNNLFSILDTFKPVNPLALEDNYYLISSNESMSAKLIYASLGTVFNNDFMLMYKIISAFKIFSTETDHLKMYKFVISCGKDVLQKFEHKMQNENYHIPNNMILCKSAPQLEILKRASLFLTHAGMNSISEAIHYGVPLVCLPIDFDQPAVAYRVADELGFGVRLQKNKVNAENIKNAMHQVLNDKAYQERIVRFSQISRRYNGNSISAQIVNDYIANLKNK